jgi:thiosulfate/3-mercaptopyruvate sulfurtransferase
VDVLLEKSSHPISLTESTVVIDVRSSFDYGLNHVNNSVHLPWSGLAENESTGELLRSPREASVRLALKGIHPGVPVVVVGNGGKGEGEEGRLAWTLLYYGFKDVQVANIETLKSSMTVYPSPPTENARLWQVPSKDEMTISEENFKEFIMTPAKRKGAKISVLDVRSPKEYFNKSSKTKGMKAQPDIGAMNIEWKEFYTADGRPNIAMRAKLQSLGIELGDQIVVLSNRGVRSSSVSYALIAMGFTNVRNFVGGWRKLMMN